jgi:hypothetical protein
MAKRLTREQKEEKAVVDLINKMFEIAGHNVTYDDVKDSKDQWFMKWTMTMEQNDEWQKWGVEYLKKTFKYPTTYCERQMGMICLMWGLKFSDYSNNI